ncbi:DUF3102 domain-containing protein [Aquibium sp. ELW1220]|uniref:DUF3102 domain-containing protein n=1 Tax=Aquibium sp. ELW1220 TaxID=2976766 RepID=UPI0025B02D40|nr:DUF3102 domain-containing protein [Aquibium sp. ELW1220]MDN2582163.1 DUF3102 domain-containing protein [Aquibium sp. ELW1220]
MSNDQNTHIADELVLEDLPLGKLPHEPVVNSKSTSANLPAVVSVVTAEAVDDCLDDEALASLQADLEADDKKVPGTSSTVPSIGKFDYTVLSQAAAKAAQTAAARIHDRRTNNMLETGADLLKVKPLLGHGNFTSWIEAEFGWSERSAQNFMKAAEFTSKNETVAVLPPSSIYRLAAKNVPESAVKGVTALIKAGRQPSIDEVIDMISEAKVAERDAKAAERIAKGLKPAPSRAETFDKFLKQKRADKRVQEKQAAKVEERKQAGSEALDMLKKSLGLSLFEFRLLYIKSAEQFDVLIRMP